jgi:glycosyltransferase involved in cell wall biosynthesis
MARMANYASFYALARLAARRIPRPDVVVSLTDPPFLGLLGVRLKRQFGDRVVALGDDMAARLLDKGVSQDRISIIRNWADTDEIRPLKQSNSFRERLGLTDKFVVMYSGNFGYVWDLDVVLDVAGMMKADSRIAFLLIGGGSTQTRIAERVREEGLENVRLAPFQPKTRLAESLSAADLHLVPMRPGVYGTVVPSKIYGILASGTPIAGLAEPDSEVAQVVQKHDCGWIGAPGDAEALFKIIREAADNAEGLAEMGARARQAAERFYSRATQTSKFAALLDSLV